MDKFTTLTAVKSSILEGLLSAFVNGVEITSYLSEKEKEEYDGERL